jgi:hypothetical protein
MPQRQLLALRYPRRRPPIVCNTDGNVSEMNASQRGRSVKPGKLPTAGRAMETEKQYSWTCSPALQGNLLQTVEGPLRHAGAHIVMPYIKSLLGVVVFAIEARA